MPNTQSDWTTTATFSLQTETGAFWIGILGTDTIPIRSPYAQPCQLQGVGLENCYMLDFNALSPAVRQKLISGIAQRFGDAAAEIERELQAHGLPVRATEVSVMSRDLNFL